MAKPSGRHPLEFKGLKKNYDDLKVILPFTASVGRGEKIALMGRNGSGKTTLLKSLLRNATGYLDGTEAQFLINGGTVTWGHEVTVGYFAQEHSESHHERRDHTGMALPVQAAGDTIRVARIAGANAIQRR